ncbi:hypothetical protein [Parasediminibacterium sp. JCM 36343]|uniref:hypothetical protein n=1 Tax=Parasediminibacterium sp. JCM 36343 TaxID=3374279 RepID=UPI00397BE93E
MSDKILVNNQSFFYDSLKYMYSLRPKNKYEIRGKLSGVSYSSSPDTSIESGQDFPIILQNIRIINSAIVINCFALFESAFESCLLKNLNTSSLTGVQEKIVSNYINDIIKLSSEVRYAAEFKSITGKRLKDFFSSFEYEKYEIIKEFYLLRNLIVHGSATKQVHINVEAYSKFEMDLDDKEYQNLVEFIKSKKKIEVSNHLFSLDVMLSCNDIIDMLFVAVITVSAKLTEDVKLFKFIDENKNIFKAAGFASHLF